MKNENVKVRRIEPGRIEKAAIIIVSGDMENVPNNDAVSVFRTGRFTVAVSNLIVFVVMLNVCTNQQKCPFNMTNDYFKRFQEPPFSNAVIACVPFCYLSSKKYEFNAFISSF